MTYNEAVKKAARSVSFQWPGVIEAEDLEQEIHLHILERPGTQRDLEEMDEISRYRTISKIAHRIASQERTDYDYYKGAYRYSVKEVKDLLADGVLTEDQPNFAAEVADLDEAFSVLADQYQDAIRSRYIDHRSTSDDKRYENALRNGIESLVDGMNKAQKRRYDNRHDGLGTRSQVGTEDHYEGGEFDFDSWASRRGLGWDA